MPWSGLWEIEGHSVGELRGIDGFSLVGRTIGEAHGRLIDKIPDQDDHHGARRRAGPGRPGVERGIDSLAG